ncbi:Short-chain-enoyl-CoA hydratase [Cercospora zeina]
MNIVNSAILSQLVTTCADLSKDQNLRAVILTGGPIVDGKPAFIGGADIKEMYSLSGAEEARAFITGVHRACKALRDLPVPVIARVNGFSLGAGLEIMASCDLRVATQDSRFGMPEVSLGLPSVVEAALLPQLIGGGRTRRLLYLAEIINGLAALEWGLIEEVVQSVGELDRVVDGWVAMLCEMGPRAIQSQKRLVNHWSSCTVEEGIQAGIDEFALAFEANEGREPREYMVSISQS